MRAPFSLLFAALCVAPTTPAADLAEQADAILEANCRICHGAAMQQSGLDLRTREKTLLGGERGPAVLASNPGRSWLWKLVTHASKPEMPPGGKLPDEDLEILRKWIMAGASFPKKAATDEEAERLRALKRLEERPITAEERQWWAFQSTVRHPPPAGDSAIDGFLDARLRENNLEPAPEADRRTLIRRVYLDLTGLPPTPEEVTAFLDDPASDAWRNLVERLLKSPHYGERWGRHWLDLVHYADSGGYERDFDWPTMWRYRDYVVQAFNQDKPYNRFILEQLAGDEIAPGDPNAHIATGYLRMVLDNNIKDERTRMDELDDNVSTTSLTFLGMTVGCARCHNHKFDPIPQKDYYQMQAVFFSVKEVDYPLAPEDEVSAYEKANQSITDRIAPLRKQVAAIEQRFREQLFEKKLDELPGYYRLAWRTPADKRNEGQRLNARQVSALRKQIKPSEIVALLSPEQTKSREDLQLQIAKLDSERPEKYATARAVTEEGPTPLPSYFLHRGNPGSKGSLMQPGVLTVANWTDDIYDATPEAAPALAATSLRRRRFAEWIASERNPLTARVMVNRIWQHHFGHGLVRTVSNFGTTGEKPSHPRLLDWLATEFVRSGWSVKHMHRLMLSTAAYRRASDDLDRNLTADSDNRFLWRMPRQRLEAEVIRDQMLAVAGTLNRSVGGPAVRPFIDPDLWQSSTSRVWDGKRVGDPTTWRRSLYVFNKRSIRYPMFEAFDQPDMTAHAAERVTSTVAPQALLMMNNAEVMLQAKYLAQRLQLEAGPKTEAQVRRAFQLALSRLPRSQETKRAVAFIEADPTGLVDFCQTLLNLNELVYRQ